MNIACFTLNELNIAVLYILHKYILQMIFGYVWDYLNVYHILLVVVKHSIQSNTWTMYFSGFGFCPVSIFFFLCATMC